MSTAAAFVHIGRFPGGEGACLPDCTPGPIGFEDGSYIGPFTLTEAMAFYWNLENIVASFDGTTFTATGSVSVDPAPQPQARCCAYERFVKQTSLNGILFNANAPKYHVADGGYYFQICLNYFFGVGNGWLYTLWNTAIGDYTIQSAYNFTATILGITGVQFYAQKYDGSSESFPGSQSISVTPSYYTY